MTRASTGSLRHPQWLLGAACLALGGCGGGAGGGVASTPAPPVATVPPVAVPTPTPTPVPAPASGALDTSEYRATVGAVSMNALAAYQKGATGAGITVGVVDTGLDRDSSEFAGRVSTASTSVAGNGSVDDDSGHGTAVAFTLAGRRNDSGTHGVAYEASLVVARADTPGTCADHTEAGGCSFTDYAIARGVDLAVTNGARVINLSMGGGAPDAGLVAAINRATAAGIVVVIAAGNDNTDDPAAAVNPDAFASIANNDAAARGLVIIAGSVGASDAISSFTNRAGNGAAHYLAAVGENVRAPCDNTNVCSWAGTSFAAPQISGAVALLAQAFPNLSGKEIVSILFASARDAGVAGRDAIYGNGVLDLTRAFAPLGVASVAGSSAALSLTGGDAMLSAPMGDATQGPVGAVMLDGYRRAFAIDLARSIDRNGPARTLAGVIDNRTRSIDRIIGGMTVSMTLQATDRGTTIERTLLSPGETPGVRAIAGVVTQSMGDGAQLAFGFAEGGAALTARLAGRRDAAFLVARDPLVGQGFDSAITASSAFRQQLGGWGVTAAMESGDVLSRADAEGLARFDRYRRSGYDRVALTLDRTLGALQISLSGIRLGEHDTLLGGRFGNGLGATRGTSWFLDGAVRLDAGDGWSLGGSLRQGWTLADVRAGLSGGGVVRTNGFALEAGKQGVFGRRDGFGLRVAQPLRVASGGIDFRLPTHYDYASRSVDAWTTQRLNLAPTGREIDIEARYGFPMLGGLVQTNFFWRRDPGNFDTLPDDRGATLRYSIGL